MAHLSVYDPPAVGLGNKDKESEETKKEEMPQAMEEIDLEEGEIIDSGGEDSFRENEKANDSHAYEELDLSEKKRKKRRRKKKKDDDDQNDPEKPPKKKRVKYIDHDRVNEEDDWYPPINPLPYPKKNKLLCDGPLQQSGFDADYYSSDMKSSPSHDEDDPSDEMELQSRKASWKNASKRQNSERVMKKKRKDGTARGTQDSKKRRTMTTNKNKRKIVKPKQQRAPPCKFFLEGRCSKGPDCPFSHATQPAAKKELCKFYVNGYCAKGENCLYMHEEFPCKFFHTGVKCYSEPNCLFSHAPLTEETRRILDKYLESNKIDDDKEKEENTKDGSPQKQQKRPSLLGSPPRHVKEAAETLQWRQYVSQMQQHQQHPRRFDRYNGPRNPLMLSPPHLLARPPNFYMDTLARSPAKIPSLMSMPPISLPPLNPNLPMSPLVKMTGIYPKVHDGESSSQEEWENNGEFHQRNSMKNDKCANIKNSDSIIKQSTAGEPTSNLTDTEGQANMKASEKADNADSQSEKEIKAESTDPIDSVNPSPEIQMINNQQTANSPPTESMLPLAPPVVIPSHLPRRQRELYLRIQQHQKEADSGTDISEDPENKNEEKTEHWYSSDEDDTEDQPLTAVLKKLQLTPLPNTSQQSGGLSASSTSTIDIAKMLTEIRQQATQKSASNGTNSSPNQQKDFWKTLLGSAASAIKDPRSNASTEHLQAQNKPEIRDPRIRGNASLVDTTVNASPPSRDPRLQRDPRLASRDPRVPSANSVTAVEQVPPIQLPLPPPAWDGNSAVIKTNNLIPEKTKTTAGNVPIPYKLRPITTAQPNYSSYVFACESNPKLLNDPRLQKYFKQMSGLLRQQQHLMEDVKPVVPVHDSKSLLEESTKVFTGKCDQKDHTSLADTWDRLPKPKVDPRVAKIPLNPPRPAGSTTPPLPAMTIASSAVINPICTASINTTAASHLPKSVADPRLTRLLHQPDHRRPVSSDQTSSALVSKPLRLQRKTVSNSGLSPNPQLLKQSHEKDSTSCLSGNDSPKTEQSSVEDSSAESSEKKKKLTSYNRKSSMDYASPLSSYEDTSSNCSYNSYNRRPQPSQTAVTSAVTQPNIPQPSNSVSPLDIRTALQESSNQNQTTVSFLSSETSSETATTTEHTPSLKEVFKTIDPTASPFC